MFISMLLGGRIVYTGKNIAAAHPHARAARLNDRHFDSFLKHFREALNEVGIQADKVETFGESFGLLAPTSTVVPTRTSMRLPRQRSGRHFPAHRATRARGVPHSTRRLEIPQVETEFSYR
jgi:hypothetical protein